MNTYRLYIDESGHHRYKLAESIAERYLALCGVVVRSDVYKSEVVTRIEDIRQLFYTDPDLKPPLHLEDIKNKRSFFSKLHNPDTQKEFNERLLSLYKEVDFTLITVVIDKARHFNQYVTPAHPYHYCLSCLLERYYKFLRLVDGKGDVMAEARGKREDNKLKEVYRYFFNNGTQYIDYLGVQKRFTSKDIKIQTKRLLIQGLELADLLSLETKYDVLNHYKILPQLNDNFTKKVVDIIQPKYYSGVFGVKGNGKKLL